METTEWQREQWASTLEGNTEHDDEYVRHAIPRQKMAPPGRAYVVPECTETERRTSRTGHDRTEATALSVPLSLSDPLGRCAKCLKLLLPGARPSQARASQALLESRQRACGSCAPRRLKSKR